MSKLLAILLELGKALTIPADKEVALKALIEGKDEKDIVDSDVLQILKDGQRAQLDVLSRNSEFVKNKKIDEAYKAAERKIKGEVELLLKEKLSLTDSVAESLEDLIEEAATATKTAKPGKAGELKDDDIKKHPAYIQLEKKAATDLKLAKENSEKEIKSIKDTYEGEKTFAVVSQTALDEFKKLNPVLSSDATKAAAQLKLVEKLLGEYKYQVVEGETIIMDKDGNVLEDELKNKVKLTNHVQSLTSSLFDFKVADDRQSPNAGAAGGSNAGGAPGMKYTGILPKTRQELAGILSDDKISIEQRQEVSKWADENASALSE